MGKSSKPDEAVHHPQHYQSGGIEVIDIIEAFGLDFSLGNVVKYVLRCTAKGKPVEDLKKARWYLDRTIYNMERNGVEESK